ncbi:MAG TPA: DUF2292 domain-containing protein [Methylococcaceae bacterium]|nr:DUF2292 domain-containing protein [Methylococcaceae bacterium]
MNKSLDLDLLKLNNHQEIVTHILSILQAIRFGSIEIVVHGGRIVQIDRHEKFRIKAR